MGQHGIALLAIESGESVGAYYQAKNMRLNEKQGVADMLGVLEPVYKEAAAALGEKYRKEVER